MGTGSKRFPAAIAFVLIWAGLCAAEPREIVVGAVYPLTGKQAISGADTLKGIQLAFDIVNGEYDLPIPLAKTKGLPGLDGATLKLVMDDHQGIPERALSATERLISEEGAVAIIGAYSSACTATASQAAERRKIPMVNSESSSPMLTERGFKWFFRVMPHDVMLVNAYFDFLADVKKTKNVDIKRVAVFCEDSLYGSDVSRIAEQVVKERGYEFVEKILFATGTNELNSEVQRLKAAKPDVVINACYLSDVILFNKTSKQLDFNPSGVLNSSGLVDNSVVLPTLKEDADYILARDLWSLGIGDKKPLITTINNLFKEKYGQDMNGHQARSFTTGYLLARAINEAGSTENVKLQAALQKIFVDGNDIIMPWEGIRFDGKGQNKHGRAIVVQVKDRKFHVVWPFDYAEMDVVWPMPAWNERGK